MMKEDYILLVLHKLEHSFGYYRVSSGEQLVSLPTLDYPHEICLDPGRNKAYIAEMGVRGIESEGQGGHTVAVFDLKSRERISTIDTGEYDRPHGLASHGKRLYITSESTKHLLVFDLESGELLRAIYLDQDCAHMVGICPDGSRAYTANIHSNSLTEVDTEKLQVLRHIPVPDRPEGMAFSPDGSTLYCVCREAGVVALIDTKSGVMKDRIVTGEGPVRVVITPDGARLAIPLFHSAAVEVVDTKQGVVTDHIAVGPHPAGTCLSPDGKLVFMSCEDEDLVYVFDLDSMEIIRTIKTGQGADAMVCLMNEEL